MAIGNHKGKKVEDAKPEIKMELVKSSEAVLCMEPEKKIISRSGDECVVALCDQWYLDYGEEKWRQVTQNCLDKLECYHDEVKKNFASTLDWLKEHACSRTYGLGSKLPWEESWLIGKNSLPLMFENDFLLVFKVLNFVFLFFFLQNLCPIRLFIWHIIQWHTFYKVIISAAMAVRINTTLIPKI